MLKCCRHGGCNNTTYDTYCEAHKRTKDNRRISKRRNTHVYNSRTWRRIASNNKIKNPICQYCYEYPSDVSDHYVELADLGSNDERNLIGCCHGCHAHKTAAVVKARANGINALVQWYMVNIPKYADNLLVKSYVMEWKRDCIS